MKRVRAVVLSVLAVAILGSMTVYAFANAPEKGSMGVWGYVVNESNATLELKEKQPEATTLVVDKAQAPEDAWIVVHMNDDGMPGERVGLAAIEAGVSRNVRVELDEEMLDEVIVAIHADKGESGEFEFDMERAMKSEDRPYFVDGMELAKVVSLK